MRNDEVVMVGFVTTSKNDDGSLQVKAYSPAVLLQAFPFPWSPPRYRAADPQALRHWWSQLHYVFDLPDPRVLQPLAGEFDDADADVSGRFVQTAKDLGESIVMNGADYGAEFALDDETSEPSIVSAELPPRDALIGFAVLLRQCLSPKDPASYADAAAAVERAFLSQRDAKTDVRLTKLRAWTSAIEALLESSLEQLVRDRLVAEEGWKVFDFKEPVSPRKLLRALNYGDLIHWGDTRGSVIATTEDEVEALRQKLKYLEAAGGLAYALCGFALFVEAAMTPRTRLLIP